MSHLLKLAIFGSLLSFVSSFFVAIFGIESDLYIVSLIFMVLIALPSFYGLVKMSGRKGLITIIILSIFAISLESIAIVTGFPYGRFSYGGGLGPKLFDLAPPAIFWAWVPMVIGAYESVKSNFGTKFLIFYTAIFLVVADLVIDPAAFTLRVWIWEEEGFFYGVPWQNFGGWLMSGLIGAYVYHRTIKLKKNLRYYPLLQISLLYTMIFWTGISFWKSLIFPFLIGVIVILLITKSIFKVRNQLQ
jgi:putative membrane protein